MAPQGQIAARIGQPEGDKAKATSTTHRNQFQMKQTKLLTTEETLKRSTDQKISLDLDEGVERCESELRQVPQPAG